MSKVLIGVFREHTFGYIQEEFPDILFILAKNEFRGASWGLYNESIPLTRNDKKFLREAKKQDFEDFNISVSGYMEDSNYIFDRG